MKILSCLLSKSQGLENPSNGLTIIAEAFCHLKQIAVTAI